MLRNKYAEQKVEIRSICITKKFLLILLNNLIISSGIWSQTERQRIKSNNNKIPSCPVDRWNGVAPPLSCKIIFLLSSDMFHGPYSCSTLPLPKASLLLDTAGSFLIKGHSLPQTAVLSPPTDSIPENLHVSICYHSFTSTTPNAREKSNWINAKYFVS